MGASHRPAEGSLFHAKQMGRRLGTAADLQLGAAGCSCAGGSGSGASSQSLEQ